VRLSFQVDRYADAGDRLPPVPVIIRPSAPVIFGDPGFSGMRFAGQVIDGDEVEMAGRFRRDTVHASEFVNHTTGARVEAMTFSGIWRYLRRLDVAATAAAEPGRPAADAGPGRLDGAGGAVRGTVQMVDAGQAATVIGGRYHGKKSVVMYLRIDTRDTAGRPAGPVAVAVRGMASAGSVAARGDEVEVRGVWWDGALNAQDLVNHTTGVTVEPAIRWRPFSRRLNALH
jgi:hypothetical protein